MKLLMAFAFAITCVPALAKKIDGVEPVRIEFGNNYDGYTNQELRRRVWQLERAVAQLQAQVFQLAMNDSSAQPSNLWTCQIQAFATTHVASGTTKASALAQVLKKCSDASNAIHCKEKDVKCGNE